MDIAKITAELGYTSAHDFTTGLAATVRWYAENEAWWRPLADRARLAG